MIYYKIYKNGVVVDVNNKFFLRQPKGRIIQVSSPKHANLISNSDKTEYYTVGWLNFLENPGNIQRAEATMITEEEYNSLCEQLQTGKIIEEVEEPITELPPQVEVIESEPEAEPVMTVSEMRNKINELETIIKQLLSKM